MDNLFTLFFAPEPSVLSLVSIYYSVARTDAENIDRIYMHIYLSVVRNYNTLVMCGIFSYLRFENIII